MKSLAKILEVNHLKTVFEEDGRQRESVSDASFFVNKGEVVCLVGESGCGKSVTALSIMGLLGRGGRVTQGQILLEGEDILSMSEREKDRIRGNQISMIFQDPLTSLNPAFTIGDQLSESIRIHMGLTRRQAKERAAGFLKKVGLPDPEGMLKKYPHTLSGGMRQRAMIAMALCCNPKLVIADEPTTALDVTIQAQIMELLKELQKEMGMALLLITHDIGVVAQMADRVLVMYAGQIVESASVRDVVKDAGHPYTRALLRSIPDIYDSRDRILEAIPGRVPEDYGSMSGCRFAPRCPHRREGCQGPQDMKTYKNPDHQVRCMYADQLGF